MRPSTYHNIAIALTSFTATNIFHKLKDNYKIMSQKLTVNMTQNNVHFVQKIALSDSDDGGDRAET